MIKPGLGFIKLLRLRQSGDFQRAFRQGSKLKKDYLSTYTKLNGLGYARLGLVVAKKIVPNATSRNKLKRIIRESFRLNQQVLPGCDIVVVVTSRSFSSTQVLWCDLDKQWSSLAIFYKKA